MASLSVLDELDWFNEEIEVVDEVGVEEDPRERDEEDGLFEPPLETAAAMLTF